MKGFTLRLSLKQRRKATWESPITGLQGTAFQMLINAQVILSCILGQERFTTMTRVYYKGAAACIIMFDLSSQQTFNSTIRWKKDLDSKCTLPNGKTIPCILVGNKVIVEPWNPKGNSQRNSWFLEMETL